MHLLELQDPALPKREREHLCSLFYKAVYRPAFPNAEHAETPEIWLPLLAGQPAPPCPLLHLVLALRRDMPAAEVTEADLLGGVLFEYFRDSRCGLVTYVCVAESARHRGVARRLLDHAVAACTGLGGSPGTPVFAEAEDPARLPGGSALREKALQRLVTLDALGFQEVPIAYRQPPLSPKTGWADDLVLLVHAPHGDRALPHRRIARFLTEFEASLAHNIADRTPSSRHDPFAKLKGDGPVHSRPVTQRCLPPPAWPPLGEASAYAVRFTFFRAPELLDPALGTSRSSSGALPRPVLLEKVLALSRGSKGKAMGPFLEPMRSFTSDITILEEGGRKLPIISLCEIRPDEAPIPVTVRLPAQLVSNWEGKQVVTPLERGEVATTEDEGEEAGMVRREGREVRLSARLVDTLALFATNHLAYSMSFVFEDDVEGGGVSVDTGRLLALLSLAGSAGTAERMPAQLPLSEIRFEMAGCAYQLHELATARLRALCLHRLDDAATRQALLAGWKRCDGERPVPLAPLAPGSVDVFSSVLRPIAELFPESSPEALMELRIKLCTLTPHDLQGAMAEIEDLNRFDRACQAIEQAKTYEAPLSDFTRQLAGLAQNVIDYHDQDRHEVNDSLYPAQIVGGFLHFVHRHTLVRIYSHSRSFARMKLQVGGCPYFYLTTICAAFNEVLVAEAGRLVAQERSEIGRVRFALSLDSKLHEAAARRIERRLASFERYVADAVPHLFRYETESCLFKAIEEQRGITLRREDGRRTLEQLETFWRDRAAQAQEWVGALLAAAVFTLTLWQVFGVVWDGGKDRLDRFLQEEMELSVPPMENYVFPWLGLPMLAVTLCVTLYFLITWVPTAIRSRRSAGLPGVPYVLQGLSTLAISILVWKLLAM